MSLQGKTLFITGASRGIGLAIALRAARDGANVAVIAKTTEPHPKAFPERFSPRPKRSRPPAARRCRLPAIFARKKPSLRRLRRRSNGSGALTRASITQARFLPTGTLETDMKRYDLMNQINARGTFLCSKATIPYLLRSSNGHILNMAPPLDMKPRWFKNHTAYTMAKFGMSMCTLGMSEEFRGKIAVNSLWPLTAIDTAAVRNVLGGDMMAKSSRLPEILADAAYAILNRPVATCTGNFYIDEEVLKEEGVSDFSIYAHDPKAQLVPDFFVPDASLARSTTPLLPMPW